MNRATTEVRKQQIIDASLKIIAEIGLGKLTIAEIAKEIGISESTIFRHFSSKSEILQATMEYIRNILLEGAKRIQDTPELPLEKLSKMINFHLELIDSNLAFLQLVFRELVYQPDNSYKECMIGTIQEYIQIVKQIVEEEVANRDVDAENLANVYFGLIQMRVIKSILKSDKETLKEQGKEIYRFLEQIFVDIGK